MSIGDVSGKMIMRTEGWERGLSSATMSLRTHGRKAKAIMFESRSATEKYSMKMAEASAMAKKFGWDQKALAFQTARLKEQFLGVVPAATRMNRAMASMKTSMMGMATGFLGPVALVGGGMMAARRAEGIRQDMRSSLAIMGEVSEQMKAVMRETASVVAAETKFSTAEASKAYYFLASAGMDAAQSIAALPTVSKFAQAGMFDLSRATDLLTDSQMALGMSSEIVSVNLENMTRVGDVLVGANTLANASVEQFAEALTNKAAAAMRMVNMSIEEGVGWLAVYANQGLKGAEAGTGFSIVLRDLQTKAIKNSAAFADLGVSVYDTSGKFRHLAEIIGDMEKAMEGMSDKGEKLALIQLGLSDKSVAYTQMLIGMSEAGRNLVEMLEGMGGKMDEVSGKQLTAFGRGWERIAATWDKMATGPIGDFLDQVGVVMTIASGGESRAAPDFGKFADTTLADVSRAQPLHPGLERKLIGGAAMGWADADELISRERKREVDLENKMILARERLAEQAKRQEQFEARMATKAGLGQAWLTQQGRGFAEGAGAALGGLGRGARSGIRGAYTAQQWKWADQNYQREQREAQAKAAKEAERKLEILRQPVINRALEMLRDPKAQRAALQLPSRTEEAVLTVMEKQAALTAEILPLAKRIAKKIVMPTEMDTPP